MSFTVGGARACLRVFGGYALKRADLANSLNLEFYANSHMSKESAEAGRYPYEGDYSQDLRYSNSRYNVSCLSFKCLGACPLSFHENATK